MRFRKLRTAFSATCLIACVLLIVLWVRSYWWHDGLMVRLVNTRFVSIMSGFGNLVVSVGDNGGIGDDRWSYGSRRFDSKRKGSVDNDKKPLYTGVSLKRVRFGNATGIVVPHLFAVLFSAALATAPWLRWRFTLRTLLIATTLVAVVLGIAVYVASRSN
jgi:hypothetical protein